MKRPAGIAWLLLPWALAGQGETLVTAAELEVPETEKAITLPGKTKTSGEAGQIVEPQRTAGSERQASSSKASEPAAEGQTEVSATAVIEQLNRTLLEAMRRGRELGYKGRYLLLEPVIREVYDFRAISRYVLRSFWKQLTPEQKEQFVAKMAEYGIAAYAAQFNEYGGEQFRILSEKPFRERFRVVKAVLEVPDDEDVQFVYILRKTRAGWKVIDVRYAGVSDLALKRSQFSEILKKKGFDALVAKLDEKIANYASKKNGSAEGS